jgi:acyl-CoA synthetase (AMP-forming)/AMP-acid ligase II
MQTSLTRNVFGILDRAVRSSRRSDVAMTHEGDERTFEALHDRSRRLAAGLARDGVAPGDRVAVLLGNRHEWPEFFFALAALGAVCVPVNVLLSPAEILHVCVDSDASCMVADERAQAAIEQLDALPGLVVTVGALELAGNQRAVSYDDLLAEPPLPAGTGPALDDLAILYYSSGTTGLPKAAAHTHAGILWNSYHQVNDLRLTRDDVYLVVPSLSWAAGFHDVTLALAWLGGRSVLTPTGGSTPDRLLAAIDAEQVSHALLVPTLLRQFLADPQLLERLRNSTLRRILTGAEPVPRATIEALVTELPNCDVLQGYGLSEFPTIATLLTPEEAIPHAGTAGRPCSITDLAIQTTQGDIVASGEGEVLLRSYATMREYFGMPEETAAAFADGWLHTGDLGTVDDEGFLTITGRKKDMIISGGLNIYPREIEEVLYRLDGVDEASVVGVPDERWGETTVAIIVGDGVDPEAVRRICAEQLASYKRPRAVLVREDPLPRNPSGKVLKRELRPWAVSRLDLPPTETTNGETRA